MTTPHNRVIWREGLFVRPQHFQQQQRHWDYLLQNRLRAMACFNQGVLQLQISEEHLHAGQLAVIQGSALFADGTFCHFPDVDTVPAPRTLTDDSRPNQLIYLALPSDGNRSSCRYASQPHAITDESTSNSQSAELELARLQPCLLLEQDDRQGYLTLPIARLLARQVDASLLLDPNFLPCGLAVSVMPPLQRALQEITTLLTERARHLSQRLAAPQQQEIAEWHDLLLLQLLNRYQPLLAHLAEVPRLHPERLFTTLAQLTAELATFTVEKRLPEDLIPYHHLDPQTCFTPLLGQLRLALATVIAPRAIPLPLQPQPYRIWVSSLHELTVDEPVTLVLAIKAQVPLDQLRQQFPLQSKIATPERIRELIALQLPGIPLHALPVVPRHLPYHAGFCYFQLEPQTSEWHSLLEASHLALHIAGEFPALELQLWAIRG